MKKITLYYTDSYDGKSSHDLLFSAVSMYANVSTDDLVLHSEHGKKPYFESHPHIHFSISHSGSIWMCAFAEDEVGADVQIITEDRPWIKLAERFFHPHEADEVSCSDNAAVTFGKIWSRKEATVKLFGIGIEGRFTTFDSRYDAIRFMDSDVHLKSIQLNPKENHAAALACCEDFEIEIHKFT